MRAETESGDVHGGEGYCNRGACVSRDEAYVCTAYGNLRLNMTTCPLTPSQPCVVHAPSTDSWNLAEQLAMPSACRPRSCPRSATQWGTSMTAHRAPSSTQVVSHPKASAWGCLCAHALLAHLPVAATLAIAATAHPLVTALAADSTASPAIYAAVPPPASASRWLPPPPSFPAPSPSPAPPSASDCRSAARLWPGRTSRRHPW